MKIPLLLFPGDTGLEGNGKGRYVIEEIFQESSSSKAFSSL